jgi:lipopolysaccharide/colanic/teichoic acid biosynthesis glycosyltransferase
VLPAADAAGLAAAVVLSGADHMPLLAAIYVAAVLAVSAASRLHRLRVCLRACDQAGQLCVAAAVPLLGLLAWPFGAPEPTALVRLFLAAVACVLGTRLAACAALRAAHRRGLLTERAVVVGAGTFGAYIAGLMREHPELGLSVVGFVDDGPPRRDLPMPTLAAMSGLADVVSRFAIGRVIVCFSSDCRDDDLVGVLRACRPLRADICVAPRLYELGMAVPRGCLDEIWGVPLVPLRQPPRLGLAVKRIADLAITLALGLAVAPVALAIAAVIQCSSGQPALFRQARVPGSGTVTPILKLRTVPITTGPASAGSETRWSVDERQLGRFSRWLRATHMDELPQLVHVLRGNMSLVGPRPERPYFAEQFRRDIPRYADRTRMRGGLTGWAQVNGLNGDTSVFDRARFDNYYAEYWSPWLDAVILATTAVQVGMAAVGRS